MSEMGRAREALRQYFGFQDFREGQAEVIEAVLGGGDCVVVMPTGGGKSLCYQLPALLIDGVAIVVSPLIALMKDQVDALSSRGIPTTYINSSLSYADANRRLSEMRRGLFKLVYVAPERFRSPTFGNAIGQLNVKLFAVDEAHCISHWGHDFRPDYLRLCSAAEQIGRPQIIALTATATPQVREDIGRQLGLRDPRVFVAGFDRPNLGLKVIHTDAEKEKLAILSNTIRHAKGAGIVYAATRKSVEQITARLKMTGLRAEAYHAGMEDRDRSRAQESFMSGRLQAMVATNAFGMGIDKADIRFVIHYHIPGSIEAYYQEVGRAGRDTLPADCMLLFNYADTRTQQFFIEGNHPSPEVIHQIYQELCGFGRDFVALSAREIAKLAGIKNEMSVQSALAVLEKAGHIERGRPTSNTVLCWLKAEIDQALETRSAESTEASLLRELVFNRNVDQRNQTEIDLRSIAGALNISEGSARRCLASLSASGLLGFRNAYLGRGIRLVDPEPVKVLRIDKKELASRAAAEQWKLRRMIDYCYWEKGCLRRFILDYFGDRKRVTECGNCSNCLRTGGGQHPRPRQSVTVGTLRIGSTLMTERRSATDLDRLIIDQAPTGSELRRHLKQSQEARRELRRSTTITPPSSSSRRGLNEEETVAVKKVLSCVVRLKGRFGKGTVAAVLRGSKSKQVTENRLNELSTYGLLQDMSQDEVTSLIKRLIQAGCIAVGQGSYPTVNLTDFGREVMTGRAEVELPD